jgi:hypothetical protein
VFIRSIRYQLDGKIESRSKLGFLMTLVEAQLRHWRNGVLDNPAAPLQVIFIANDEWWVTRRRICRARYVANRLCTNPTALQGVLPFNPLSAGRNNRIPIDIGIFDDVGWGVAAPLAHRGIG